ncbi:MAG: hypothetical protein HQL46_12260 [Gammaproteobacteria bacterium]|nr:hypothetical protein [Gammaproteobacteria bacterium]
MQQNTKLTEEQQQFLIKRQFFYSITRFTAWGIMLSSLTAWGILYWLKPNLVDSSHLLNLIAQKQITFIQLAEVAVTGASAISALFFLLIFIAVMLFSAAKKEQQYLEIIHKFKDEQLSGQSLQSGEQNENNH